ncbi:MAG: hypothetical protein JXR58_05010 [Bacteroidales bacterium]|nr:hypothetical protein [Bacteroidales bacterium]
MKNLKVSVIALFFGAAFLVSSCGPSLCDCIENEFSEKRDSAMSKKCEDKYKDPAKEDVEKCMEEIMKKDEKKEE